LRDDAGAPAVEASAVVACVLNPLLTPFKTSSGRAIELNVAG